jgi:hypothetical protein
MTTDNITAADVRPGTIASRLADGSIGIVPVKGGKQPARVSAAAAIPPARTAAVFSPAELKLWAAGAAALRQTDAVVSPEKREPERDTVALIQSVGLSGFAAASPPKGAEPQPKREDGDDVIALALSVGLRGYVKPNQAENGATPAPEGDK